MDSVDYTQRLNRTNEIYQKNLKDMRDSHEESLSNVEKQADKRVETVKKSHKTDKENLEKSTSATINDYKTEQQKALKEKTRNYEQIVESNKEKFHKERKTNQENWRQKFDNIKETFDDNIKQNEDYNKKTIASLDKNQKENLEAVRNKSETEVKNYIKNNQTATNSEIDSYMKDKKELQKKSESKMHDLIERHTKDKTRHRDVLSKKIQQIETDEQKRYIDGKNLADKRFKNLATDFNNKYDKFENERIEQVQTSHEKSNRLNNELFSDKYIGLEKKYNDDMRDYERRQKVEKIAQHNINKQILGEQRANEQAQYESKLAVVSRDKMSSDSSYQKKLKNLGESYQETFKNQRIEFSDRQVAKDRELTEQARQERLNQKLKDIKISTDHDSALKYSEDRATDRLESVNRSSKTKIDNLKSDYAKGLEVASKKARNDFEKNREETVKEKAILQKRLHEQNSQTNSHLKKFYNRKIEKIQEGLEKRILELRSQNKLVQANAHDMVKDIAEESRIEIERQRDIAMKNAKTEVMAEREDSIEKQRELRKTINLMQANFTDRMNEQANHSLNKLKQVTMQLEREKIQESKKYRDVIEQDRRYFERELSRLKASSVAEREILVDQYESRIKQLEDIHKQKLNELSSFDRLSNQA